MDTYDKMMKEMDIARIAGQAAYKGWHSYQGIDSRMDALKYNKTIPIELVEEFDVICVSGKSWIADAIKTGMPRMFTKSEWSHCALVILDENRNKRMVIEAAPEGVIIDSLEKYCNGSPDIDAVSLLRTKTEVNEWQGKAIYSFLKPQVGTKYDKAGLLGFALHIIFKIGNIFHHKKRWFCSELVAEAFRKAGRPISYLPSELVSPRTVFESQELQRIL